MSIKVRLVISYIGMIVIPIIIIALLSFMVTRFNEDEHLLDRILPFGMIMQYFGVNSEIEREINLWLLDNDIDEILNTDYIDTVNDKLDEVYSGIIIRKDQDLLYIDDEFNDVELLSDLPSFKEEWDIYDKEIRSRYIIHTQKDFYSSDGSEISLFIVTDFKSTQKEIDKNAILFIIGILIILIFTTIILTYSLYKDISKSIKNLKTATNEIKNGNLDYKVKTHLNDEIGNLSDTFEQMRIKLKNSTEMQKKYEENRKNLISNISHDLKTPLMSIEGYIEGIKDGVADTPEKMDRYINTIYEKSKDMEVMIEELFVLSRLDLEREIFEFRVIDLIEFLKYSVEEISFDIEKFDGTIDLKYSQDAIPVRVDVQKLKRLILNTINNSVKYKSNEQLKVIIKVEIQNEDVVVEIKDNGKGISEKALPYIFDRFYRADESRNTAIRGSGLGLAISKQIIEKHGGRMWAESKEDEGTSIFFSLNLYKGEN